MIHSPIDINTMSTVPEHPEYFYVKVGDVLITQLTNPTSSMKYMILTELVLLTSVLSVTWIKDITLNVVAQ